MGKVAMYLDDPTADWGRSSYMFFDENDRQHLEIPGDSIVLVLRASNRATLRLRSYFNGALVATRDLKGEKDGGAKEFRLPLADLVPLTPGEAYFEVRADDEGPVRSTTYCFVADYLQAYDEYRARDFARAEEHRERLELESSCPPPQGNQTYKSLADEKRKSAYWNGCQSFHAMGQATELTRQANIAILKGDDADATSLFEQANCKRAEAARFSEAAALHLKYANFYLEESAKQGENDPTAPEPKSIPTAG